MAKKPTGIYSSGETVTLALNTVEQRRKDIASGRAVGGLFQIPEIDDYVIPLWPQDLMYILGLPSNGKSFTARMFQKTVVEALLEYGDGNRVGVWTTVEESVPKIGAHWLSNMSGVSSTAMLSGRMTEEQQVTINASVAEVGSWPLYVIGHSGGVRNKQGIVEQVHILSRPDIDACINYLINVLKKDIAFMVIDYLQKVRQEDITSGFEQHVRNTVSWTREIASWINAPLVVPAQSKAKVADRSIPIPGIPDTEWSMNAGQSADALLGVWMPKTSNPAGSVMPDFGKFKNLIVEEDMMFVGVGKQKDAPGGKVFLLRVKPHLMKWELLEVEEYELNPEPRHQEPSPSMGWRGDGDSNWPSQREISF